MGIRESFPKEVTSSYIWNYSIQYPRKRGSGEGRDWVGGRREVIEVLGVRNQKECSLEEAGIWLLLWGTEKGQGHWTQELRRRKAWGEARKPGGAGHAGRVEPGMLRFWSLILGAMGSHWKDFTKGVCVKETDRQQEDMIRSAFWKYYADFWVENRKRMQKFKWGRWRRQRW